MGATRSQVILGQPKSRWSEIDDFERITLTCNFTRGRARQDIFLLGGGDLEVGVVHLVVRPFFEGDD